MEKGLFGTQRNSPGPLSIPEPCDGDEWTMATETLPTPCAQEVDADFGKLLQSPKPQLVLRIPSEVGRTFSAREFRSTVTPSCDVVRGCDAFYKP
eukprot:4318579-Pyramimonas_sp.AAC.1